MKEEEPSDILSETEKYPAEFEFHQERFRKKAEEFAKRGLIKKMLHWNAKMSAEDFAHEEALRDDADFERRKDMEFQEWEKGLQQVINRVLQKRDHPEQSKGIHPLLLILGGGMKGPYSAGQGLGLNELGLRNVFDTVVGISAGAATAAYFVAGGEQQSRAGASLFYKECTAKDFINFRRLHHVIDTRSIAEKMRKGEKALDQKAIVNSDTEFYVGVTRDKDGEEELLNVKTAKPDMIAAVEASMDVPLWYRDAVEVDGAKYIDGAFDPVPIEKVIKKFSPTDILILPNTPFDRLDAFRLTPGEYLFAEFAPRTGFLGTVAKLLRIKEEIRKSLEHIQKECRVNIGILWPPDSGLRNATAESDQIKSAMLESARGVIKEFGGVQPKEIRL